MTSVILILIGHQYLNYLNLTCNTFVTSGRGVTTTYFDIFICLNTVYSRDVTQGKEYIILGPAKIVKYKLRRHQNISKYI